MMRKIRLTESELISLIRTTIKESENEALLAQANKDLQEVDLPTITMDELNSDVIPTSIVNQTSSLDPVPNKGNEQKGKTFELIKSAICSADENELNTAKKQIKDIIKQKKSQVRNFLKKTFGKKEGQQDTMNEQVELAAATTILGVTAPLWVWVAIGALVLFLILRALLRRGEPTVGCRGETWRQVLQRINPDGNY
jgi:hypothetical protein